jgi:hypothetical protein
MRLRPVDERGPQRPAFLLALLLGTLALTACGDSDSSTGSPAKAPAAPKVSTADDADAAGKAASGFVSSVRAGDGAAACKFLTGVEQKIFVTNAGELRPKLDAASCASVVESFNQASGAKADQLDGSLQDIVVTADGDFASGNWVWSEGRGQQAVLMEKVAGAWQFGRDSNDFPTAMLHFFEEA